ncbi:unnamed protein product [Brassica oleracea var. botrytis]
MVLGCVGVNCEWRIYATKVGGCSRFEIRTLEPTHTCNVDDRWRFRSHATSSIMGNMLRNRYGGTGGVGPRPGAVMEIMRNVHSIPITYWKAWKSREIAIDRGSGNADTSYLALPTYLAKL